MIFFFTFFNASGYFGVSGNFWGGREGAKPPVEAEGHHKNKRPEGPRCSCMN